MRPDRDKYPGHQAYPVKIMKQSIYVVDDQTSVLEMTVMVLRRLGRDWEVTGFSDPQTALAAIREKAPHAILTDQVMPGMEGSELLEKVRLISPSTLRFIMSGCVSLSKLTLITSAHQYIAKPFDLAKIQSLFKRSFAAQQRIQNHGLESVATSLRSIPSLPQIHHSLLKELDDDQSHSETIARLIGADPGLSIKVLQLANSSLFGQGRLITDLTDAISCLGTDLLTAIILSQSVFHHYEGIKHPEIDLTRLWSHCWETACIAQRLCREKKLPNPAGEETFLAGLLHEVGRFILVDNFPDQFQTACDNALRSGAPLAASLREVFQSSPFQLSAYVLELWGMPPCVVDSVSHLDEPETDASPDFSAASALYIAHQIASKTSPADAFPVEPWKKDYLKSIGCLDQIAQWEKQLPSQSPRA